MVESTKDVVSIDVESINKAETKDQGSSFIDVIKESIEKVNMLQGEADMAIEGLVKGETKNVHDTMVAIEEANGSFNMMLQVRNKLIACSD